MKTYDTCGIWSKNPEAWKVQRELVWAAYWLLTLATHWPGPDSAGIVLLDFIARLHDSGMWVIAYAGDYAGLRLDMPRKTCQDGIQWLKESGYLIHCAGKGIVQSDGKDEGQESGWDPMRYELNLNKLLELLMENPNMDKANFSMPAGGSLPAITERRKWVKLGGFCTMVVRSYLSTEPVSVNRLAEITGRHRNTVTKTVNMLKKAGLVSKSKSGWVVLNSP